MRKTRKSKISSVLLVGIMCFGIVTTAFGSTITNYYQYEADQVATAIFTYRPTYSGQSMDLNTRPSSGQAGVTVWVAGSNGTSVSNDFPYYASVPPLHMGLASGVSYTAHVVTGAGGYASGTLQRVINR